MSKTLSQKIIIPSAKLTILVSIDQDINYAQIKLINCGVLLWPRLDTPAGLELELVSNSSSSPKLTLALEVFG
jgi:hypothetical protein